MFLPCFFFWGGVNKQADSWSGTQFKPLVLTPIRESGYRLGLRGIGSQEDLTPAGIKQSRQSHPVPALVMSSTPHGDLCSLFMVCLLLASLSLWIHLSTSDKSWNRTILMFVEPQIGPKQTSICLNEHDCFPLLAPKGADHYWSWFSFGVKQHFAFCLDVRT